MSNPRSILRAALGWLHRKPQPIPHIVFSRSKAAARKQVEADTSMTPKLVADMTAAGLYVPAYFTRSTDSQVRK